MYLTQHVIDHSVYLDFDLSLDKVLSISFTNITYISMQNKSKNDTHQVDTSYCEDHELNILQNIRRYKTLNVTMRL